ncbi:MarR family winged helix-turn-helix transcriptional regulator [Corynebacterium sp.]|nr:MarR family transcriptional regulator [Corynebacterium sp.]MDN6404726.1 winged helix DNA-binding protein [Corynebacterium sp.]
MTMQTDYWYDGRDPNVELLEALRRFRGADHDMRQRMCGRMRLNSTDLEAIRLISAAERAGAVFTARDLSSALQISTAATAKLLNRLTGSGHVVRTGHPSDRRSVTLTVTDLSRDEMSDALGPMHDRMMQVARQVSPSARREIIDFLDAMVDVFTEETEESADTDESESHFP